MKKMPIYQVDAFSSRLFEGNPAAVCPLAHWLSEDQMQAIAAENNLSETAFIVPKDGRYQIRWFTPNKEVELCGHATLASAFVIFEILQYKENQIIFDSKSGELIINKKNNLLEMSFPSLPFIKAPFSSLQFINFKPSEIYESTFDLLLIFDNEDDIKEASVDLSMMSNLNYRGIILSAPAKNGADIYSRCFYPRYGVPEDPVTGSAHCVLAPYWSKRLDKKRIHAIQGLKRQGEIFCEVQNDRVLLSGSCQLYLEGNISYL